MIAIRQSKIANYGDGDEDFSPSERFPEYTGTIATSDNPIYSAVRDLLYDAGLDRDRFGTAAWNPFGRCIKPRSRVFVLCNFVFHRRQRESVNAFSAKCTHASVLRPIIDYLLLAVGSQGCVTFGNAPLQSCDWDAVLRDCGATELLKYYQMQSLPVRAMDLRLAVAERSAGGRVLRKERRSEEGGVTVDFSAYSTLLDIDSEAVMYRVSDYDPARTEAFHGNRRHRYVINREILESDVIFSVPKLKTHEKVGITCTVKGCVGTVGHKDSLAHHRAGAPGQQGDEYPTQSWLQSLLSRCHEEIYRDGGVRGTPLKQALDVNIRRLTRRLGLTHFGAWHGNDTTWRMAVDLARIVQFVDSQGNVQQNPTRKHLALIDGIVGGEGEGPLSPQPVESGALILADNIAEADMMAAIVMGFDPRKLPIVERCFDPHPLPVARERPTSVICNGRKIDVADLAGYLRPVKFKPPSGWRGYL